MTRQGGDRFQRYREWARRFLDLARVLSLAAVVLLAGSRAASGSHLAGGRLSWVQDTSYPNPTQVKVRVTYEGAFRWSFDPWPSPTPDTPPGSETRSSTRVFLNVSGTNSWNASQYVTLVRHIGFADGRPG